MSFVDIVIFTQFLRKRGIAYLIIMGVVTGTIFLTKLEIFLAVAVALSAGFVCLVFTEKVKISRILKLFGFFTLGFIVPISGFLIYFLTHMDFKEALIAIIKPYNLVFDKNVSSNIFALRNLGFDDPFSNISMMLFFTMSYIVILTIMCLLTFIVAHLQNKPFKNIIRVLMLVVVPLPLLTFHVPWPDLFRPLPLVMLTMTVYFFIRIFRTRHDRHGFICSLSLFVMTVFASMMLLKIILNVHVYHYGFALAMPAVILLVMALLYQLPRTLGQALGGSAFFRGLGMVLLLVILVVHIQWSKQIYDLKTYPVGHGSDKILSWNPTVSPQGMAIDFALKQIKTLIPEDQNFIALPEGIILNYLARRQSASPNIEFMPSFLAMVGEGKIIRDFDVHKADFIVLVHRDTLEFGARYFGVDYAVNLASWLRKNYSPVARIGDVPFRNNNFGIIIAKRMSLQ